MCGCLCLSVCLSVWLSVCLAVSQSVKLRQATLTRALICVCRTCALGKVRGTMRAPSLAALVGVDLSSRIRASTLVSRFLSVHYSNARTSVCRVRTSRRCVVGAGQRRQSLRHHLLKAVTQRPPSRLI